MPGWVFEAAFVQCACVTYVPMASRPAEAARLPSGWNATAYTAREWPSCGSAGRCEEV
jgi:hypothetical protein